MGGRRLSSPQADDASKQPRGNNNQRGNNNNKQNNKSVEVVKVIKDGTKRTFFACMANGKYISSTMFARQYDANRLAKNYCNA